MARGKEESTATSDLLTNLSAIVSELLPLFLEQWASFQDRPRVSELESRLGSLRQGFVRLGKRVRFLTVLCVLLVIWNIFLSVLLFIGWQM